jgi:hypothetical protein
MRYVALFLGPAWESRITRSALGEWRLGVEGIEAPRMTSAGGGENHWAVYARRMTSSKRAPYQTWNAMLRMARGVLSDGKARDIATIYADGIARGLVRQTTKPPTMYASLERYIIHTRALGRRPLIASTSIGTFA